MVHCKTLIAMGEIKVSFLLQELIELTARRLLRASVCTVIGFIGIRDLDFFCMMVLQGTDSFQDDVTPTCSSTVVNLLFVTEPWRFHGLLENSNGLCNVQEKSFSDLPSPISFHCRLPVCSRGAIVSAPQWFSASRIQG